MLCLILQVLKKVGTHHEIEFAILERKRTVGIGPNCFEPRVIRPSDVQTFLD
jgi:hypothetical protein